MKGQVLGKYTLLNRIGSGSFGQIFQCEHNNTKKQYAAKIEPTNTKLPRLALEIKLYNFFSHGNNIPKVYWHGVDKNYKIMVMDLLGKSLENLHESHKTFSLKSTLIIIDQMISCIEFLHKKNYIHRDIKPDNFVMGVENESNKIYLIDFGLAKRYRDPVTLKHIKYSEGKSLTGTARYASVNALRGIEQSRRDDMEAAGFVWIYLLKGTLPWTGLTTNNVQQKYSKICECKINTSFEDLCNGLPYQFVQYFKLIRELEFTEEPNYSEYRKMFRDLLIEYNYLYDGNFDWCLLNRKRKSIPLAPISPQSTIKLKKSNDSPASKNYSSNSLFSGTVLSTKVNIHDSSVDNTGNDVLTSKCDLKLLFNFSNSDIKSYDSRSLQIEDTIESSSQKDSTIASSTTTSSSFSKDITFQVKSSENYDQQYGSSDFMGIFQKIQNGEPISSNNSIDQSNRDEEKYNLNFSNQYIEKNNKNAINNNKIEYNFNNDLNEYNSSDD
ncbi:hypothetical protein M9Y10_036268 [Tritrichomonas musculus]|uniref:non-specific serine/threonine protein kinase n=1 Tax=Tritrichomonas musculus TaxID=1915356 RepID=A0ABR2GUW9_9EUKA